MDSKSFDEAMSSVSEDCSTSSTTSSPRTDNSEGPVPNERIRINDYSEVDDEVTASQLFMPKSNMIQAMIEDILLLFKNEDLSNVTRYKMFPPEAGNYLQGQHQIILNMVNNIMSGRHGWVYISPAGDITDAPHTQFLDVTCFTTTEPVKVFTFIDGNHQEAAAQSHNSRVAGIVTDVIIKHCPGFKFAVVYGAIRTDFNDEYFLQKMKDCNKTARELSVPHSLDMNFEKFKAVSMGFLKEITERVGSSEHMDTHDLSEKLEAPVDRFGSVCIDSPESALNPHQQDIADIDRHVDCEPLNEHEQLRRAFDKLQEDHMKLKSFFDQERGIALELGSQCSYDTAYGGSESGSDMMSDTSSTSGDSGVQDGINTSFHVDVPFHAGQKRTRHAPYSRNPTYKRAKIEYETSRTVQPLPTRLTRRHKQRQQKHLSEKYLSTMNTSLHIAATEGLLGTVQNILSCGFIDINCKGEGGKTPLMMAAENGKISVFDFLINRGSDCGVIDDEGNTILHAACNGGDLGIIKRVLQWGMVDRNWKNKAGLTAMMTATGSGKTEVCKLLASCDHQ